MPQPEALIIGAGPAGLMAAEELAKTGAQVVVCEAKPTVARKFLMAGKSGLNVTKDEDWETFVARYDCPHLRPILRDFGPNEVQDWCRALGQDVYTGSSGRVFPVAMKASPLLRAWAQRLTAQGVEIRTRWRWTGFAGSAFRFDTPIGPQTLAPKVTVLALGGASWQRLGSDGAWVPWLRAKGVAITDWQPANMGFRVDWSTHMTPFFGSPVKGIALLAGPHRGRGEFIISARGVEGGGIYSIYKYLRDAYTLTLDLLPDLSTEEIARRLARMKPGESTANRLRKLGLDRTQTALVMEFARAEPFSRIKQLSIPLQGPRPLDEAISVAGGIAWDALTPDLELQALPDTFAAGEMLDWEAPTGGYLLTAAWATGRWAGLAAARRLTRQTPPRT
ncbi:TIGR03862 family flavoprotein [Tabrizicola sp.]|uniref:TIGR03862 family flavoprotein n=1 Tax=Tabrizicola sp. TaxID=2005166 RepID=UPI0025E02F86|nr:TIGR03862 family flavoprotein [Tabrizicola sp.]MBY0350662.1 TIGR03862 family flavoprotein [Tabrizicola sp.]